MFTWVLAHFREQQWILECVFIQGHWEVNIQKVVIKNHFMLVRIACSHIKINIFASQGNFHMKISPVSNCRQWFSCFNTQYVIPWPHLLKQSYNNTYQSNMFSFFTNFITEWAQFNLWMSSLEGEISVQGSNKTLPTQSCMQVS